MGVVGSLAMGSQIWAMVGGESLFISPPSAAGPAPISGPSSDGRGVAPQSGQRTWEVAHLRRDPRHLPQ